MVNHSWHRRWVTGRPSTPLRNIYVHIETLPVRALKASWHTPHRTAFFFPTYSDPPSVNIPFFCNKIFGSSRVYKTSSSKLWNSFSSLFFYVWLKKLNLRTVLKSFCRSGPSLYPLKPCISSWSLPARRYSCPNLGGKGSYQISQELNVFWHLRNFASWKCPSFDFLKKWEKKKVKMEIKEEDINWLLGKRKWEKTISNEKTQRKEEYRSLICFFFCFFAMSFFC